MQLYLGVLVFDVYVTADIFQANVFGASADIEAAGRVLHPQIAGIHFHLAGQRADLQIGARGIEAHQLAHIGEADVIEEIAIERNCAAHILDLGVAGAAREAQIAGELVHSKIAVAHGDAGIAGDLLQKNVAVGAIHPHVALTPADFDIAVAGSQIYRRLARQVDIQVVAHMGGVKEADSHLRRRSAA